MKMSKIEGTEPTHHEILVRNLKILMQKHRINGTELSRRSNVPQPTIHKILAGKTVAPRICTLKRLANYFCISLDIFCLQIIQFEEAD